MSADSKIVSPEIYQNPVYPRSFPDPFVLKYRGEYYAYCTDFWRDGRVFGVLRSRDLVNWKELGGAMQKLEGDAPFYWAPEVTYANGKFYLYYSVGNETLMELRVAVSDRPDGGFVDSGKKLSTEDFAIDAHVFTDDDGQRYFFYATDFLEHTYIGTGTVVDKMIDFFTLEGRPRPVARARYDWQVYDPARQEKGGVRWHTVEGPFILKRKGIYYEMFSGGNWQNITYGVSFAITDDLDRQEEWTQFSDGETVLPILRTIPDLVVGPGHNSAIRGLNNRELYCVYHRWTEHGRTLSIDRMDFAGKRIFIKGATYEPQIAPFKPTRTDFFDDNALSKNWQTVGAWEVADNEACNEITEKSLLICTAKADAFLTEFSFKALETVDQTSGFGFCLLSGGEMTFEFLILPKSKEALIYFTENNKIQEKRFQLPKDFVPSAYHLLRVELDALTVKLALDETVFRFAATLEKPSNQIALVAEKMRAAFSGFAFTCGFEDLFEDQDSKIESRGWKNLSGGEEARLEGGEIFLAGRGENRSIFAKGAAHKNFEFAVNLRSVHAFSEKAAFGLLLTDDRNKEIASFSFQREPARTYLISGDGAAKFELPESFAAENYHQFRFLKLGSKLELQLEDLVLGEIAVPEGEAKIAMFCRDSEIALEMARLTVL